MNVIHINMYLVNDEDGRDKFFSMIMKYVLS